MRTLSKIVVLASLVATPVFAQGHPQTRQGFTISFGIGGGSAGVTCGDCDSDREWGPSLYLQIAGTPRPNLILGGEINGWSKTEEDATSGADATFTISTINFIAQWYPQVNNGFFLNGGIGLGTVNAELDFPGFGSVSENTTGFGFQAGAGYDFRLSRNFSLTPYAKYFSTVGGEWQDTNEKFNGNVFHFGLGFTWH